MNLRLITLSVLIAFILSISLAVSPSDSIPPFQYDFGVRARGTANPLNGQCDLRYASELTSPISISKLYYSTDGQNSWSNVNAILDEGDRYTAATPSIAGDAHWRFYFESAETWGGQTPVYTGTSTCRLPINYYTMWDDPAGIDSSAYGGGDWLDIIKAGFCVSSTRFYGIIIKTNSDYRETDGESWGGIVDLYDDNYGYLFSINNPAVPTSNVFYSIAKCRAANPPDIGGGSVELAPGILKVVDMSNIYAIGDAEIVVVAETMFVSCLISDLTGDADFGTWPNDKRYLNVSAQTMHLHIWGYIWALNTHFYMADEMKNGHAYYKNPIAEWKSSPSAPNTPPVLTGPYVNYDAGLDITEVGITYQDADENPPEYVNLDILGRVTYHLQKDQIEGPYGWITGIWYSAEIPGYHGFGADFTFVASDGIDEFILPAGPMYVDSAERPELAKLVSVSPNPFNSVCKIEAPVGARVEIFDIRGSFVDAFNIADQSGEQYWQPSGDVTSGVYYIK
ncbi:hypothetical protein KAH81_07295, partial [bacterium]|nr:hypothetical protein [bacterium]